MRSRAKKTPPLAPGDRLTRDEFERRFDATPGLKKAELLDGIVHVPPPVSHEYHSAPDARLLTVLGVYQAATPHTLFGGNGSLRLDASNMPQPDAYLMIAPNAGGQALIDADGYVAGAPELIAEVAASSASYDLHVKMDVYARHGVREYVVWRTYDAEIDYFVLRENRYERIGGDEEGVWRSESFPGLALASRPLLEGDLGQALAVLREGIASPEHGAFVARLRERARS
ncbi:MAG TPA: Uma2 family endonuclease [Gammaproteobacteria bacterium]|nr:Uma2 family endonuclease [Gammaproteobacteria bacterium]